MATHYHQAQSQTVLIVDDERAIAEFIAMIVEEAGHRALLANNGRAALLVLAQNEVNLLITDLMMPVMGGIELIHRLRTEFHGTVPPIILMSAVQITAQDGSIADATLAKPFEIDRLEYLIARYLAPQAALD